MIEKTIFEYFLGIVSLWPNLAKKLDYIKLLARIVGTKIEILKIWAKTSTFHKKLFFENLKVLKWEVRVKFI